MPYVVRKQKGKKCVYKKKKNGKPGKKVGCTDGPIKDYLAALHINANESLEDKTMKISRQKLERIIKEEVAREMRMRKEAEDPYAGAGDATGVEYEQDLALEELAGQIVKAFPDLDRVLYGRASKAVELLGRGSIDEPDAFDDLMFYIAKLVDSPEKLKDIRDEVDDMLSHAEPT